MQRNVIRLLLGILFLSSLFLVVLRCSYILQTLSAHSDAQYYLTIGRSVLNGLIPYQDIFDPKAPGVLIIAALSYVVFSSSFLGHLLSAFFLFLTPCMTAHIMWRSSADLGPEDRRFVTIAGFVLGSALALWPSMQAGVWQPESFGNVFFLLYLWVVFRKRMTMWRMLAAALCLGMTISMKEPFLLSSLGAVLILHQELRPLWRSYCVPLGIAVVAGSFILLLLGWLGAYIGVYLPVVAGFRIGGYGAFWQRGMLLWSLQGPLSAVSALLLTICIIAVLWRIVDILRQRMSSKATYVEIGILLLGLYLATTVIGLGGNVGTLTYSAGGIPVISALGILWLVRSSESLRRSSSSLLIGGCIMLLVFFMTLRFDRLAPVVSDDTKAQHQQTVVIAERLDALLDACETDRYLFAVTPHEPAIFSYTKHSPLNHFLYREVDNPRLGFDFLRISIERLSQSAVILTNTEGLVIQNQIGSLMQEYIDQAFSTDPWPCAKPFMPLLPFTVYFRTSPLTVRADIQVTNSTGKEETLSFDLLYDMPPPDTGSGSEI